MVKGDTNGSSKHPCLRPGASFVCIASQAGSLLLQGRCVLWRLALEPLIALNGLRWRRRDRSSFVTPGRDGWRSDAGKVTRLEWRATAWAGFLAHGLVFWRMGWLLGGRCRVVADAKRRWDAQPPSLRSRFWMEVTARVMAASAPLPLT